MKTILAIAIGVGFSLGVVAGPLPNPEWLTQGTISPQIVNAIKQKIGDFTLLDGFKGVHPNRTVYSSM